MSDIDCNFRVEGRVQGVGFRMWTRDQARGLGLRGWVRNRDDGSVEVHVSGAPEAVETLRESLRTGPPAAHVRELSEGDGATALPESGFQIRRS
ncbi:MAG: acylphosphatase [Gemmatimonadota bacterium]